MAKSPDLTKAIQRRLGMNQGSKGISAAVRRNRAGAPKVEEDQPGWGSKGISAAARRSRTTQEDQPGWNWRTQGNKVRGGSKPGYLRTASGNQYT